MKKTLIALLFLGIMPLHASSFHQEETFRQHRPKIVQGLNHLSPVSSLEDFKSSLRLAKDIGQGRMSFVLNRGKWFISKENQIFLLSEGGKSDLKILDIKLNRVEHDPSSRKTVKLRFYYSVNFTTPYIHDEFRVAEVKLTGFFNIN